LKIKHENYEHNTQDDHPDLLLFVNQHFKLKILRPNSQNCSIMNKLLQLAKDQLKNCM